MEGPTIKSLVKSDRKSMVNYEGGKQYQNILALWETIKTTILVIDSPKLKKKKT